MPRVLSLLITLALITQSARASQYVSNGKMELIKKRFELPVPHDKNCLYTSIMLGYLIPVIGNEQEFKNRLIKLVGEDVAYTSLSRVGLEKHAFSVSYLQREFSPLAELFIKNVGIKNNQTDYTKIRCVADSLGTTIRVFAPDITYPEDYTFTKTIKPNDRSSSEIVRIVKDSPIKEELILGDNVSRPRTSIPKKEQIQHYRVKLDQEAFELLYKSSSKEEEKDTSGPFRNLQDREEKLKPKDTARLTLEEVIRLIDNYVFVYDRDSDGKFKDGGKYLEVLKKEKVDEHEYSNGYMSFVCNELVCHYLSNKQMSLAGKALELQTKYESNSV